MNRRKPLSELVVLVAAHFDYDYVKIGVWLFSMDKRLNYQSPYVLWRKEAYSRVKIHIKEMIDAKRTTCL